ncbi:MAG: FMN-binding protein [Sedimentisphaeraceae bacterium JB056]
MENKKQNVIALFISESWLLIVASLVFGLLLAGVNYALKPKIEANANSKQTEALKELLLDAQTFEKIVDNASVENIASPVTVFKGVKNGMSAGWVFTATGPGYADKIDLLIAVDSGFEKIVGYKVLFSNETVGFGDKIKNPYYKDQFAGAPVEKLELLKMGDETVIDNNIIAISGATISSNAVVEIFNTHLLNIKTQLKEKGLLQ